MVSQRETPYVTQPEELNADSHVLVDVEQLDKPSYNVSWWTAHSFLGYYLGPWRLPASGVRCCLLLAHSVSHGSPAKDKQNLKNQLSWLHNCNDRESPIGSHYKTWSTLAFLLGAGLGITPQHGPTEPEPVDMDRVGRIKSHPTEPVDMDRVGRIKSHPTEPVDMDRVGRIKSHPTEPVDMDRVGRIKSHPTEPVDMDRVGRIKSHPTEPVDMDRVGRTGGEDNMQPRAEPNHQKPLASNLQT
ncbi:hypothetical protein NHX12_021409 [Muraenolepis orangiensis]|uniref:Uncharacterized protein n=1 Tax=Muraenolepis orangiensis TaxID=630683 RepID=A0A9Q0IUE0_9TELE|nr:hypothetical protein NHX12_021409 [Muraenolepis orangiensis]